jgi:CBS domain-containing protein
MNPGGEVTDDPLSQAGRPLAGRTVADVVVRRPRVLDAAATVAAARSAFEDDHVHMLLLTSGDRLLGTLVRDDLTDADATGSALDHAVLDGRTIDPAVPADVALRDLVARGERRRAVVDDDGRLLGLLCLKRRLTGFCSDHDVAARQAERQVLAVTSGGSLR